MDRAGFFVLLVLPSILYGRAFLTGAIPRSMDTVMYFFPLRWHAGQLLRSGDLPWWNRCILGGMPLFSNPQAALAYPLHWLMLVWPSAPSFTLPMTLQLGLWGAMTAMLLRALGANRWVALWGGGLCIAGNYGWSRLQYGNYMNVLPWWPIWLLAAHRFAATRDRRWIVPGAVAVGMSILAGAHQLALYGGVALAAYSLVMVIADRGARLRWIVFILATAVAGVLIGAAGWLPQWEFLRETSRGDALAAQRVLAGSFGSLREILAALIGPLSAEPADAEASAAVGALALIAAGLVPTRRKFLLSWLGGWLAVIVTILPSWRPVMEKLLEAAPVFGVFHDPRRWIGATQWLIVIASSVSLAAWIEPDEQRLGALAWRSLPAVAIAGAVVWITPLAYLWPVYGIGFLIVTRFVTAALRSEREEGGANYTNVAVEFLFALLAFAGLVALAVTTWRTTDLGLLRVNNLFRQDGRAPLISQAPPHPGERFFSVDWQRASSYDYKRPDLADWLLPNIGMLYGYEDIGGYEPARTERYDRWLASASDWPGGRQPWAEHFGLLYPPYPTNVPKVTALREANLAAAILPRWGFPADFRFDQHPGRPIEGDYYPPPVGREWRAPPPDLYYATPPSWPSGIDFWTLYRTRDRHVGPPRFMTLRTADSKWIRTVDIRGPAELPSEPREASVLHPADVAKKVANNYAEFIASHSGDDPKLTPANNLPAYQIELALPPIDYPLGIFAWADAIQKVFEPIAEGEMAMICRYNGPAQWATLLPASLADFGGGDVVNKLIEANRMRLKVNWKGRGPGVLEIHDAYWNGWKAKVNGAPAEVRPSGQAGEGLWRWIEVPAGESEVELTYFPPLLFEALGLTLVGALLIALLGLIKSRNSET